MAIESLAEPQETPKGLESLRLTKSQANKINQWLNVQGQSVPLPNEYADFVRSVLHNDQLEEFRRIIETGGR